MPILQLPVAGAIAWLLAFAFTGAGIFNAMGGAVVQEQFLRPEVQRDLFRLELLLAVLPHQLRMEKIRRQVELQEDTLPEKGPPDWKLQRSTALARPPRRRQSPNRRRKSSNVVPHRDWADIVSRTIR